MKNLLVIGLALTAGPVGWSAAPASASYNLPVAVFPTAAGRSASAAYSQSATVGESIVGRSTGGDVLLQAGFQNTASPSAPSFIIINNNFTLAANDITYENLPVKVAAGATLTILGEHHFKSLLVEGTVNHPVGSITGLSLVVDEATVIAAGGSIDASTRGPRGGRRNGNPSQRGEALNADGTGVAAVIETVASHGTPGFNANLSAVYGDAFNPLTPGAGGGASGGNSIGGGGGGVVRLVTGSLELNGSIYAGGDYGYRDQDWGGAWGHGGSGGSVNITLLNQPWSGSGRIEVIGGVAYPNYDQRGGHGRIAVKGFSAKTFSGDLGPAGSIYLVPHNQPGQLWIGNTVVTNASELSLATIATNGLGGFTFYNQATLQLGSLSSTGYGGSTFYNFATLELAGGEVEIPHGLTLVQDGNLTSPAGLSNRITSLRIRSGGALTHGVAHPGGLNLRVDNATIIDEGGSIDVSGNGLRGGHRSGNPSYSGETHAGDGVSASIPGVASHGTPGYSAPMSALYGDPINPTAQGSGGGASSFAQYPIGGNGGGLILLATGSLQLNGLIAANGDRGYRDPFYASSFAWGGSGGSINITLQNQPFIGSGRIQVDGGLSSDDQLSGYGRIAIKGYSTKTFAGALGLAGTTYFAPHNQPGELRIGNTAITIPRDSTLRIASLATNGLAGSAINNLGVLELSSDALDLPGNVTLVQDGIVKGAGRATPTIGSVSIRSNATVTHTRGSTNGVQLKVEGPVLVEAGGSISVSGRGLRGGRQDGFPVEGEWWNDGNPILSSFNAATYGEDLPTANPVYGNPQAPAELGTGGRAQGFFGGDYAPYGGNGGGRVFISARSLHIDGSIDSDGSAGYPGSGSPAGGGSGGAIWIQLAGGELTGSGAISARGGPGVNGASRGGSGRIAITDYSANHFAGDLGPTNAIYLRPASDPLADDDGDGLSNADEIIAGTDPRDPMSVLRAAPLPTIGDLIRFQFPAVPGHHYQIEWTTDVSSGLWQPVPDAIQGAGPIIEVNLEISAGLPRFYRIRVE